jgi:hypothetical protein
MFRVDRKTLRHVDDRVWKCLKYCNANEYCIAEKTESEEDEVYYTPPESPRELVMVKNPGEFERPLYTPKRAIALLDLHEAIVDQLLGTFEAHSINPIRGNTPRRLNDNVSVKKSCRGRKNKGGVEGPGKEREEY